MATRTRTTNRVATEPTYKSKSEHVRALLDSGETVANAAKVVGIGYAFAYGIAKRAGKSETAANRRAPANGRIRSLISWMSPTLTGDALDAHVAAFIAGQPRPTIRRSK